MFSSKDLNMLQIALPAGTVGTPSRLMAIAKLVGQWTATPAGMPWQIVAAYLQEQGGQDIVQIVVSWYETKMFGRDAAWGEIVDSIQKHIKENTGVEALAIEWFRITPPDSSFWIASDGSLNFIPLWYQTKDGSIPGPTQATVSPSQFQLRRGTDASDPRGGEAFLPSSTDAAEAGIDVSWVLVAVVATIGVAAIAYAGSGGFGR